MRAGERMKVPRGSACASRAKNCLSMMTTLSSYNSCGGRGRVVGGGDDERVYERGEAL